MATTKQKSKSNSSQVNFYPVILAGGRGTRFWPLSRKKRAKQLLALDGKETMLQQTVSRLRKLSPANNFWILANDDLRPAMLKQVTTLDRKKILAEPAGRNTAPAIGLAAFILLRSDPNAVIGMFPSDHVIGDEPRYRDIIQRGAEIAAAGENIVVLGIQPTGPVTGYGYIETGADCGDGVKQVRRFTEKPELDRAKEMVAAGNFYWNSGMFLWSAKTLAIALTEYLPASAELLRKIAATYGTPKFAATFKKLYPKCENISIDYAVLEPRSMRGEGKSNLFCIPSEFGWNDLGSWTALHEHHAAKHKPEDENVIHSAGKFALNASGNYVHAPGKFVAIVGVEGLVVVETADALLITTRENAQDVGKVVKHLDAKKLTKLV